MAILTTIAGIPLFSTTREAIAWARANGLNGYHTHGWQGITGYMGGVSHAAATGVASPPRTTTRNSGGGGGY